MDQFQDFFRRATLFKHDLSALQEGKETISYVLFDSVHEVRKHLSVASEDQRKQRQKTFFNPPIAKRSRLGQGIHDRGEAFVFADEPIHPSDSQGLSNHFPAHGKLVSILRKTIKSGQTWDVTVSADKWGIDKSEELYTSVNIGELILEPGAKIVVRGNVFSMVCERVISNNRVSEKSNDYQIGILPTPFSLDTRRGLQDGKKGEAGKAGHSGKDGISPIVQSSLLGLYLTEETAHDKMDGENGSNGTDGENGGHGRNGGMSKIAEITIGHLEGNLQLFSQAGKGGNGGNGGNGGHGGNGGNGGNGNKLFTGILEGGKGGNAGNGGNGGHGGNGANGGLSSNIYIILPPHQEKQLTVTSLPSRPGEYGKGGSFGLGGEAGKPGEFSKNTIQTHSGKDGIGAPDGRPGKQRDAPWIFLNEKPISASLHESRHPSFKNEAINY